MDDNEVYQQPIVHGKERTKHTTQKPLRIVVDLIRKHSKIGDTVLDCFLGSGTTAVACKMTERNFIGCDIIQEYVDIGNKRLGEIL